MPKKPVHNLDISAIFVSTPNLVFCATRIGCERILLADAGLDLPGHVRVVRVCQRFVFLVGTGVFKAFPTCLSHVCENLVHHVTDARL